MKYEKVNINRSDGSLAKFCKSLTVELVNDDKYVNAKLITWDGDVKTRFRGTSRKPEDIRLCYATGILKIGSVYRQGENYHVQVFFERGQVQRERDVIFKSQLSDDDSDSGYDTVN